MATQNVNALFTDLGSSPLAAEVNDHSLAGNYARNTYHTQDSLVGLAGQDAVGTWTLTICDQDATRDAGEFHEAAWRFNAVTPGRPSPESGRTADVGTATAHATPAASSPQTNTVTAPRRCW
ncbi:MAG: hypothetical protein R2873_04155 [Caldilineaceae bacterium]